LVEEGEELRVGSLLRLPLFLLMIVIMVCAGASEATMTQWASAFTESALGVSKTVGDLAGPCLFAAFMGLSRVFYGKKSDKIDLTKIMLVCGSLCVVCYLLAALSPISIIGLIGCALCGLAVGIMWPGTISICAKKCPKGGTAMFAFLALAGDFGAAVGPTMVGGIAEAVGGNLKTGLLFAIIFPIVMILGLILLIKKFKNKSY
jgi:MFS family permease